MFRQLFLGSVMMVALAAACGDGDEGGGAAAAGSGGKGGSAGSSGGKGGTNSGGTAGKGGSAGKGGGAGSTAGSASEGGAAGSPPSDAGAGGQGGAPTISCDPPPPPDIGSGGAGGDGGNGGAGADGGASGPGSLAIAGNYMDEFGTYVITSSQWVTSYSTHHISAYDNDEHWVVALNDEDNAFNPCTWSRFDWTETAAGLFLCTTVYDAATKQEALDAPPADASDPETDGCGSSNFPWTLVTPQ